MSDSKPRKGQGNGAKSQNGGGKGGGKSARASQPTKDMRAQLEEVRTVIPKEKVRSSRDSAPGPARIPSRGALR